MLRKSALLALVLSVSITLPLAGWSYPSDMTVTGIHAPQDPFIDASTVHIDSTGAGVYMEENAYTDSGIPTTTFTNAFAVSAADLDSIWAAVTSNNFFSLPDSMGEVGILGSDFLELTIRGNGSAHTVLLIHGESPALDAIVTKINAATPPGNNLQMPSYVPGKPTLPGLDPSAPGAPRWKSEFRNQHPKAVAWFDQILRDRDGPQRTTANPPKHPGSTASYCCSLQAGVESGKVEITGTGAAHGSAAKITVDNSTPAVKDKLKLSIYLEFWGPEADSATVASIVAGVTNVFGSKSSGGKDIDLCVNTKLNTTATSAPNTPGYHQIELRNTDSSGNPIIPHVHAIVPVNDGTGGGTWLGDANASYSAASLANMYAHEVGHLLGLPDRYKDWRRLPNGNWQLRSGGAEVTPAQLGTQMFGQFGTSTEAGWQNWLGEASRTRFTPICPGVSATDIMASIGAGADVSQSDVDNIVSNPGLKISVHAGDVLVNENDSEQDLVVTKSCDFFVPKDSTFCWDNVQATCIDPEASLPTPGGKFDVTTNICFWQGFDSADNLKKLIEVINDKEAWADPAALDAIWWVVACEPYGGYTNTFLACANLSSTRWQNDWPEPLSNSGNGNDSELVYPLELITLEIDPWWWYWYPATPWGFNSFWVWPDTWPLTPLFGLDYNFNWTLPYFPLGSFGFVDPLFPEPFTTIYPDSCGSYLVAVNGAQEVNNPEWPPLSYAQGNSRAAYFVSESVLSFEDPIDLNDLADGASFEVWQLCTSASFSGTTSLAAGLDGVYPGVAQLTATLDLDTVIDPNPVIKFNLMTALDPGHQFVFLVDGVPQHMQSGDSSWEMVSVPIPPGGTGLMDLTWLVDFAVPASVASEAFIDDLMLPGQLVQVGVPGDDPKPTPKIALAQNRPNPALGSTEISFVIPQDGWATLNIYDAQGRMVTTVFDEMRYAGEQTVSFDASGLSAGMYFYRLATAGGLQESRKMIVVK